MAVSLLDREWVGHRNTNKGRGHWLVSYSYKQATPPGFNNNLGTFFGASAPVASPQSRRAGGIARSIAPSSFNRCASMRWNGMTRRSAQRNRFGGRWTKARGSQRSGGSGSEEAHRPGFAAEPDLFGASVEVKRSFFLDFRLGVA